ncbi:MAG: choice-of-anchor Q domain-containing protein [Solirubrobacterales bacterium]
MARWRIRAAAVAAVVAVAVLASSAQGAVIDVTTTGDAVAVDGDCSLREAVNAAEQNSPENECTGGDPMLGPDQIALGAASYGLTGAAGDDGNLSGDLDIFARPATEGALTITGQGSGQTTIDANVIDRVLHLPGGGELTVEDVKIQNGSVANRAGGILGVSDPDITLDGVELFNNQATVGAGGIELLGPDASLKILGSEIHGNSTVGTLGGGGVLVTGSLEITGSSIHDNSADTAQNFSGGGGGVKAGGTTTITESSIHDNSAGDGNPATQDNSDDGGGIHFSASSPTTLTISNSTISGNSTERFGGGLSAAGSNSTVVIEGSTFEGNSASTTEAAQGTSGAGIYNANGSTLEISNALFRDNQATAGSGGDADGGGVHTEGFFGATTTIAESLFQTNSVSVAGGAGANGRGGGLFSGADADTRVEGTTFTGNFALASGSAVAQGGAIAAELGSSSTVVVNSTIAGNSAVFTAASTGGGIQQLGTATIDVVNSTISGNSAPAGPGLHRSGTGDVTLKGTIIHDEPMACVGGFTSAGHNVDRGSSCVDGIAQPSDLPNTDPMLGPLADNGGPHAGAPADDEPIPTMALPASGSDALNHIAQADCTDDGGVDFLAVDQRGFGRPFPSGGSCDVGAFEYRDSDGDGIEDGVDPTPFGIPPQGVPPQGAPPQGAQSSPLPSSAFDLGKLKRNKKKGIAFLFVNVPGPGEVGLAGKGVKNVGIASASARKSVFTAGGVVKLRIKPGKGKKARKLVRRLKDKGKAKLKVRVTYVPTGGLANTQARKVKLVRK